ncbi:siphovirus Gp157 family protein, partial [Staphylococcus auricularis]|uniref:siphovirus Gp157 family protein n=1 Tax=Staphylococcus auricularis TaxID=29379 RepID=UPI000D4DF7A0
MSTIFELTDKYREVYDLITEQGDMQVLTDTLDSINDALEDKADGYIGVIKTLESDKDTKEKEIKQVRQRKTTNQNRIQRLKVSLQYTME